MSICRVCGKCISDFTSADLVPRVPRDGDVSLCLYCQTWSIFERGEMRAPTSDERAWIDTNVDCIRAARVVAMVAQGGQS